VIGGSKAEFRNVISGNSSHGIRLLGNNITDVNIENNYIGLSADGSTEIANSQYGVLV